MASLQEFLEVLADAYPDEKVRGKKFEPFLRDALVASPSHQFADVWLWDDWPGRDGPERGIDLVARGATGQKTQEASGKRKAQNGCQRPHRKRRTRGHHVEKNPRDDSLGVACAQSGLVTS